MNLEKIVENRNEMSKQLGSLTEIYKKEINRLNKEIEDNIRHLIYNEKCFKNCELVEKSPYYLLLGNNQEQQTINKALSCFFSIADGVSIGCFYSEVCLSAWKMVEFIKFCKEVGIKFSEELIEKKKKEMDYLIELIASL